jgi:hypothetical protein
MCDFMEQISYGRAVSCSASRAIARILCNLKICYRVNKSRPHVPILSHINPCHTLQTDLLKIYFNIILLSTAASKRKRCKSLTNKHYHIFSHQEYINLFESTVSSRGIFENLSFRLRTRRSEVRILAGARNFSRKLPNRLCSLLSLLLSTYRGSFPGVSK